MATKDEIRKIRLEKVEKLRKLNINPYPYEFKRNSNFSEIKEKHNKLKAEQKTKTNYKTAGRIMLLRGMGKLAFLTLQDEDSQLQIVLSKNETGEKAFELLKLLDLGDIIGVEGYAFKTKKGELSIMGKKLTVLTKSLEDIGEKYHGITDVELRYRNRSLDMVSNPEVKKTLKQKNIILQETRNFMIKKGFLEVETPILQTLYGGDAAKPFESYYNDLKEKVFLRISLEQDLKKIMAGGMEAVFEIGRIFRNESIDTTHNPEFTAMEAYIAYKDYNYMMELTEQLVYKLAKKLFGKDTITFKGKTISVKPPWKRMTVKEAIKKTTKIDIDKATTAELLKHAKKTGKDLIKNTREEAILILHEEFGEKVTNNPIHFIDYPKGTTVFAKQTRNNPETIEKAESFICGIELANMYSELNDPYLQRKHMEDQMKLKTKTDEVYGKLDESFLKAMDLGIPPAAGIGIGLERLQMLLLGQESIRDVLYFPAMKTKK